MIPGLHIVIAEDDEDDRFIIENAFRRDPQFATVDLVRNGRELLEYLRKKNSRPDVILTDINMPVMDGLQALEEIRSDQELRSIPAFVYSTTVNPAYQLKCLELGTRGYLTKPNSLQDFNLIPGKIVELL